MKGTEEMELEEIEKLERIIRGLEADIESYQERFEDYERKIAKLKALLKERG